MAKELPYFKFEPGEWETGNIQLVDFETQGIFINICSIYWQRLGDLPYKLAVQKVCGGNATALQSLSDEKIIEVIEGNIYIKFLDEQLSGFEDISNQNRENALKRWRKKRNATAEQSECDRNASREEENREEENKKEKRDYSDFLKQFNQITGKRIRVIDDKTKRQLNARINTDGFTMDEIYKAIENCKKDKYHIENPKYLTPEFITRSDKLQKFLNAEPEQPQKQRVKS